MIRSLKRLILSNIHKSVIFVSSGFTCTSLRRNDFWLRFLLWILQSKLFWIFDALLAICKSSSQQFICIFAVICCLPAWTTLLVTFTFFRLETVINNLTCLLLCLFICLPGARSANFGLFVVLKQLILCFCSIFWRIIATFLLCNLIIASFNFCLWVYESSCSLEGLCTRRSNYLQTTLILKRHWVLLLRQGETIFEELGLLVLQFVNLANKFTKLVNRCNSLYHPLHSLNSLLIACLQANSIWIFYIWNSSIERSC